MEGNLATHQGIYNLITQYGNTMQPTYSQEGGPGGRKTLAGPLRSDGFATKVKYKSHKSLRSSGSKGTPGETRPSSVRITTVCMKIPTNKSNRRGNMWDSTGSPPPCEEPYWQTPRSSGQCHQMRLQRAARLRDLREHRQQYFLSGCPRRDCAMLW